MTTVEAQPVLGVSPVLDIGGDIGALVVYLLRSPDGGELEMEPVGDPAGRFHTGVHRRASAAPRRWSPCSPRCAGTYDLLDDDGVPFVRVAVRGGEVVELDAR